MSERLIQFPREQYTIVGNNVLKNAPLQRGEVINFQPKRRKDVPLAFNHEFYEGASEQQIKDDVVSYLGEYRFEVPEFSYTMSLADGRLTDPNSGELMTSKAKKAIDTRKSEGLSTEREEAELEGLIVLEKRIKENPKGTIVWLSPPGKEKDGYGPYGFGYRGEVKGNVVEMSAIRVENPTIEDFNRASLALWGEEYQKAEDFLRSPQVLDVDKDKVKDFIVGNFEIGDEQKKSVFNKAISRLRGAIGEYAYIVRNGTSEQKRKALNALENISIEVRRKLETPQKGNVVYLSEYIPPSLGAAMQMKKYTVEAPKVAGSCGVSQRLESNNIFSNINYTANSAIGSKNADKDKEWFTCPKCNYKADGPVGNMCPGCGLTKEQYAQESEAEICD